MYRNRKKTKKNVINFSNVTHVRSFHYAKIVTTEPGERPTCTEQCAAITPSTGLSENGSNDLSDRRIKSGFSKYLQIEVPVAI